MRSDGTISLEAEAKAIRWAVDQGARVINLSLGGLRDPLNPARDTYSPLEAAAVEYAVAKGVVVVAAVGNGDQAPTLAVAVRELSGRAAARGRRQRDRQRTARCRASRPRRRSSTTSPRPGEDILSTLPRALTRDNPSCIDQGYSDCGPDDYRHARRHVVRRAAGHRPPRRSLIAQNPGAAGADQVATLLERSAVDLNATNGCTRCATGRDALTGWGRLDIAAALAAAKGPLPPRRLASSRTTTSAATRASSSARDGRLDRDARLLGRPDRRLPRRPRRARAADGVALRRARRRRRASRSGARAREPSRACRARRALARSRSAGAPRSGWRTSVAAGNGGWYYVQVLAPRPAVRARTSLQAGPLLSSSSSGTSRSTRAGLPTTISARRHVLRHDRARADERLLADLDARAEDRAAADARAAADRRALDRARAAARCGP